MRVAVFCLNSNIVSCRSVHDVISDRLFRPTAIFCKRSNKFYVLVTVWLFFILLFLQRHVILAFRHCLIFHLTERNLQRPSWFVDDGTLALPPESGGGGGDNCVLKLRPKTPNKVYLDRAMYQVNARKLWTLSAEL